MMKYRVIKTEGILIVGCSATANFETNAQITQQLAKQFMPRLSEILFRKDEFKISLQKYDDFNFKNFTPIHNFEKWIGVEVRDFETIPKDLRTLKIEPGNYLIFDFEGSVEEFIKFWQYLHAVWLPNSEFKLDNRPHFERLLKDYNPARKINREEIWIPVK